MATTITEAQAELISSLAPDDIPIKLRCAICSKLAVNAFRLPCCEQAICETCQSHLPPSCPVCEHSPLSAEDCNSNKSLRTTIRVFLRTAEKKREAGRPKETKTSAPATPIVASKPSLPPPEASATEINPKDDTHELGPEGGNPTANSDGQTQESGQDANQAHESHDGQAQQEEEPVDALAGPFQDAGVKQSTEESQEQVVAEEADGVDPASNDQEGPDSEAMNGGDANTAFSASGDYHQMQMMMAMQNGMGPNSFGNFSMMGMPGMGMDPMTMQNMYMNGGFQGMGMNGMNGMGGYGGGFGQGSNNNWNGSQSWNFDQNNYNQSGPGMGTGEYGNYNSGFQTGYNQGNYGQFNDYRRGNYGRGRGRGRGFYGGYGRGGNQNGGMSNYQDQGQMSQYGQGAQAQLPAQNESDTAEGSGDGAQVDEYGRAIRPSGQTEESQTTGLESGQSGNPDAAQRDPSEQASRENLGNEAGGEASRSTETPPNGSRIPGSFHSRNGSGAVRPTVPAPDVPINAPKGPKAMRQGLPNTSLVNLRARGYQPGSDSQQTAKSGTDHQADPTERPPSRSSNVDRERERDHDSHRERSKERSRKYESRGRASQDAQNLEQKSQAHSRTQSSRSRSRDDHKRSHRHRRQRSESVNSDGHEDSHRRKKYRSSKHSYFEDENEQSSRPKEDKPDERSRSASPDDSKRSSHRSRRHRDSDKRRDRDKDQSRDDDRQRSSHRSQRDRDHDHSRRRDKERDRERDKDRKDRKERHRERDRDGDYRHSSSRKHSTDGTNTPADKSFDPPSGPRGQDTRGSSSHEKGKADRKAPQSNSNNDSSSHGKDAHTLEREARNRERLLKEAQRMAGLAGLAGTKRSREDSSGGGDDGGRKSRRPSRRGGAVDGGDEEERMQRLEAEREGGRWG